MTAREFGKVERCVTWRCPRMDRHTRGTLTKPCPDCYTLEELRRRVPYQHSGRSPEWRPAVGFVDGPGQLDLFEVTA